MTLPRFCLFVSVFASIACGPSQKTGDNVARGAPTKVIRYAAKFDYDINFGSRLHNVVEYNDIVGSVTITKSNLATPPMVLNSNTIVLDAADKAKLTSILSALNVDSYSSSYAGPAHASDGDGFSMQLQLISATEVKKILIDLNNPGTLPEPLFELFNATFAFSQLTSNY